MEKVKLALVVVLFAATISECLAAGNATSGSSTAASNYSMKADEFLNGAINNNYYTITVPDYINTTKAEGANWLALDVRPKDVYAIGHIPGAINIPLAELMGKMDTIPRGKKIAVYCCLDVDAAFGVMALEVFGNREALVLQGGMEAWNKAGMDEERSV